MRFLYLFCCWLSSCTAFPASAQSPTASDIHISARQVVDTLASAHFWGRGYTKDGLGKAAAYLSAQFKALGLQPMKGKDYLQTFNHPVNTFPGMMSLKVNGRELTPGEDFIVAPISRGVKGRGALRQADSVQYIADDLRLILKVEDKLTWSVAGEAEDFTLLQVRKGALDGPPRQVEVQIEQQLLPRFTSANVCGLVKGTERPDSLLLITAHYDHLGGMGQTTYFPGANDNASGVALLLRLAEHYAAHPGRYSVGFLLFAGEEAGLLGSRYFTEHPLVPLKNVRFLLNTDLAGTGEDGITVVNAWEFKKEFDLLSSINTEHNLLKAVNARGKAANSDHHFFTELGVPSFFFYTLGGIAAYHDVHDRAATLPLTEHDDLFHLTTLFADRLMR